MRKFIINLIKEAGKILARNFRKDKKLIKLRGSAKAVATKYDKMIDRFLIQKISQRYPNHSFLTEESGFIKKDSDFLWIIDSLDGTGNFASGNPLFAVCLALCYQGQLILGLIFAPVINEFYIAEKGKGAFLNKKRIFVSKIKNLKKSYLLFCEGAERKRKRTKRVINKIYPRVTDLRKLGSAGLETAWVATGRAEAYLTTKIEPWDVAPGVLLVKEAGGKVTDFRGNPWKLKRSDLLFSNKKVHSEILSLIKNL